MTQVPHPPQETHFVPGVARAPRFQDQVSGYTMRRDDVELEGLTMPFEASGEVSSHTVPLGNLAARGEKAPITTAGQVEQHYSQSEGNRYFDRYTLLSEGVVSVSTATEGVIPTHTMVNNLGVGGKTSLVINMTAENPDTDTADNTVYVVDRGEGIKGRFMVVPFKTAQEWRWGPQQEQDLYGGAQNGKLWMFDPGQSAVVGRAAGIEGVIGIPTADNSVSKKQFEIQFDTDAITVANLSRNYTDVIVNPTFRK